MLTTSEVRNFIDGLPKRRMTRKSNNGHNSLTFHVRVGDSYCSNWKSIKDTDNLADAVECYNEADKFKKAFILRNNDIWLADMLRDSKISCRHVMVETGKDVRRFMVTVNSDVGELARSDIERLGYPVQEI